MQRIATDITARLAQIAKDPPDLLAYLRLHADVVLQTFQPVGLAYEMGNGQTFQRTFAHNHESLKLRESPAQELAFQRAVRSAAEQARVVFLDANTSPMEGLHGLNAEDAPAPENLPLHNQTPYQQVFVPIPLGKKVVGVLHAWFTPADANGARARATLLAHAAAEVELYLKARRISDISQELARINTYARFLEDVAGDQELESVSWKLVNYAREAVGCDRVCLFVDSRYGLGPTVGLPSSDRLSLQACSGLRRPHARSEHAEVLKAHASELLKLAVGAAGTPSPAVAPTAPAAAPANRVTPNGVESPLAETSPVNGTRAETHAGRVPAATPASSSPPTPSSPNAPRPASETAPAEGRPQMRIVFTHRDPAKVATRPEAVNRYFEVIPMNWSTVLPLYDRHNRVCGTLLFEGQQSNDKMAALFTQMRDLAVSGGRALSTALTWERRSALRGARALMRWRDTLVATPKRRIALKYGLPLLILALLLAFPFPYRIRGDATLRPVTVHSVAALTTGRLMEINAREGDRVTKGQVLCVLDSTDLQLQLRQTEQEHERALTEASLALRQDRNETRMQIARLQAEKAAIMAEKLRRDIELTTIRAPFDGVLVGPPDITQRRGEVIRVGETIAEIVDPDRWEVKVSVREQHVPTLVAEVARARAGSDTAPAAPGVRGELVLAAHPNEVFHLVLADPTAFSHRLDTAGGKYNFSAIVPLAPTGGELDATELTSRGALKTGYTGRVRFSCGRRPLAQILFGDFVRFMKLTFF